jgi:hypothetical protein
MMWMKEKKMFERGRGVRGLEVSGTRRIVLRKKGVTGGGSLLGKYASEVEDGAVRGMGLDQQERIENQGETGEFLPGFIGLEGTKELVWPSHFLPQAGKLE